jgi:hypothetical protein
VTNFASYQPPGVYVEEENTPLVSALGLTTTIIALVGPSEGFRVHTEAINLTGTNLSRLTKTGVVAGSVIVRATDGLTNYTTSDFTLTEGAGEDINLGAPHDNPMDIARSGSSTIDDGDTVLVTYHYTDAAMFAPALIQDFDDVKALYGQPFNPTTGEIISPISLAAKIAFDNGAVRMYLVATDSPSDSVTRTQLSDALAKLVAHPEVNVVVPLPVGVTGTEGSPADTGNIGIDLKNHCVNMANDKNYRVGLLSFDKNVTVLPTSTAATVFSSRVQLHYPYRYEYFNGFTNQVQELGGYYAAAGYAGRLAALRFQDPLTRKQLSGISGIPGEVIAAQTRSNKDMMSAGGVAVTERTRDSRLVMRHGVMTDMSTIHTRELSLVRSRDALLDVLVRTFDTQGIIGSPISDETAATLKAVTMGVLESVLARKLIVGYNDVKVRQRSDDPTVMEVKFQFRPAYPLNYVVIVFSVNTQTGATEVLQP